MSYIRLLLVVSAALVGGTHGIMHCNGLNMMEVRNIIMTAINNAVMALQQRKAVDEQLRISGQDETNNRQPFSPMSYFQHYAAFAHLNSLAELNVDSGYIITRASKYITEALGVSVDEVYMCPFVEEIWRELITPHCMRRNPMCDPTDKYRTTSGECNNLANPTWGSSTRPHNRLLRNAYVDDIKAPRIYSTTGDPLPSCRTVSNNVHNQDPCCPQKERDLSLWVMQWGQNVDHDITDTAIEKGNEDANIICCDLPPGVERSQCFPIPIDQPDARFGVSCMNFVRSVAGHTDNCDIGRNEQLNQATSWLDASFLYGHNSEDNMQIRSYQDGQLVMTRNGLFGGYQTDLAHCELLGPRDYCMRSGDFRVHVMPGLTAIQVLFLREHNRIAKKLKCINPVWSDEELYQETRKIVIAIYQHVLFSQWLQYVIGPLMMTQLGLRPTPQGYNNIYDSTIDGTITNEFGVGPYRLGHTLLQDTVKLMKGKFPVHIANEHAFNRPAMAFTDDAFGCAYIGAGLAFHASSKADGKIVNSVRNNLFVDNLNRSFDLIALNCQRAREHGIPGYNEYRRFCGLSAVLHFGTGAMGLVDHTPEDAAKLASTYSHPDDMDIFAAGMSEIPLEGAVIGPTFACFVGLEFQRLQRGDRFYYENEDPNTGFRLDQLNSIKRITLAKLMCYHFHLKQIQIDPFRLPSDSNPIVHCDTFGKIDLELWRE